MIKTRMVNLKTIEIVISIFQRGYHLVQLRTVLHDVEAPQTHSMHSVGPSQMILFQTFVTGPKTVTEFLQ